MKLHGNCRKSSGYEQPSRLLKLDTSPMSSEAIEHLLMLCNRFSYLGIGGDIAALSIIEAKGLYLFLIRLAEG